MAPLTRALAVGLTLVVATTGIPVAAGAQSTTSPPRTASDREARAHFLKAEKAFNLGRFEEALVGYEAAYQARPLPALLFNIAQCHRNLGDSERAVFFYRRYLALEPRSQDRELVQELISEQQRVAQEKERAAAQSPRRLPPGGLPASAAAGDPAAVATAPAPAPAPTPLYKRWWVWTVAGVAVAGVAAALLIPRQGPLPSGQLESVDRR